MSDGVLRFRPTVLEFRHSTVTFEYGPAGVVGRIDYHHKPERRYIGPLSDGTIRALAEVARA